MCSKAKAARKGTRDEAKAQADARARKAAKGYQATTQARAQRLLRAIDAAGLPDESKFAWRYYWKPIRVSDLRRWAAGQFSEEEDLWTSAELDPERIESPVALAQLFGCTTDYLLGLTDDFRPAAAPAGDQAPEPQPEAPAPLPEPPAMEADEPPAEGWVPLVWLDGRKPPQKDRQLAAVKLSAEGIYILEVARWSMSLREWRYPSGGEIGPAECVGWFPLPDDEEDEHGE